MTDLSAPVPPRRRGRGLAPNEGAASGEFAENRLGLVLGNRRGSPPSLICPPASAASGLDPAHQIWPRPDRRSRPRGGSADPRKWPRTHLAALERRGNRFRKLRLRDGRAGATTKRIVSVSGQGRSLTDHGRFIGYRGAGRDVTRSSSPKMSCAGPRATAEGRQQGEVGISGER